MDFTSGMTGTYFSTTMEGITSGIPWSQDSILWILIVGFVVAFILAFAVGANDVANSFGTTVGAKVLNLKQACILATIFETAGAVLLGAKVGETIRKGIIDVNVYDDVSNGVTILMLGELSAMFGSAVWQLIATVLKLPVSGTHSIVGACIGFSLVAVGPAGVNWKKLGLIVGSWFISPVISGLMTIALFVFINRFILLKKNPLRNGLRLLPFFYAITIGINAFSIMFAGAPLLGLDHLPVWAVLIIGNALMLITGLLVYFIAVPRVKAKAEKQQRETESKSPITSTGSNELSTFGVVFDSGYDTPCDPKVKTTGQISNSLLEKVEDITNKSESEKMNHRDRCNDTNSSFLEDQLIEFGKDKNNKVEEEQEEDAPEVRELFSSLQVVTACFASFAHGGNDVSNAIGPLIALWLIFWSGEVVQQSFTPWYLLVYGGVGICAGLWILGRRVIETIGSKITKVTPSRGFCIELMTAITVLIASNVGLPVSTTHCKVGAVVSVGWLRSTNAVDWSVARNIAIAWFITVPVSALISAGCMWILMQLAL